jgi:hypothetical protein
MTKPQHKFGEDRWPPGAPDDGTWIAPVLIGLGIGIAFLVVLL